MSGSGGAALGELAVTLSRICSAEQVAARALAVVTAQLGASSGWIARVDHAENRLVPLQIVGDPELPAADDLLAAVVAGELVWLDDVARVRQRLPGPIATAPQSPALVLVPITAAANRTVSEVLGLAFDRPRSPLPGESEFLSAVAALVGQGLDRAGLRAAERAATARAAAAAERAENLAALTAALAATVTVDDVAAALEAHLQPAVACQTFSLREVDTASGTARAIRLGGTPIGYQDRFTDLPLNQVNSAGEVISTRAPVFLSSAQENRLRYGAAAAERYEVARGEALARLPLLVEGELIAILSVAYWTPRQFDTADRQFLTTVADLAAQALGRASRTQRLRSESRRHRLCSAALAAINRRLDPADQLRALTEAVVPELADISTVHVLLEPVPPGVLPVRPVITRRVAGRTVPGIELSGREQDLVWDGDEDPMMTTIVAGRPLAGPIPAAALPDWARPTVTDPTSRTELTTVLAPVIVGGLVVAIASFGRFSPHRQWDSAELEIVSEIAGYAAVALEHGLSYQQTRETALVLQHSLLSEPPVVDGLAIVARYEPAGRDAVGGDWYDAFEISPGNLAIAVGDVVGHDITAAAAMGQLRAVLRALALDETLDPGAVLDRLGQANRCLQITPMATVLFARLTRTEVGWSLRWACAGHPPPLLVEPGGPARALTQISGVALVRPPSPTHRSAQLALTRPGSILLLYTDGLIERRGTDLRQSIDALCTRVALLAEQPLDALCDQLLADGSGADDMALLALRLD